MFEEKADEDVVILELEFLCIHMEGKGRLLDCVIHTSDTAPE